MPLRQAIHVVLLVGGIIALAIVGPPLKDHLSDPVPYAVYADSLSSQAHEHLWLEVKGRLATEYGVVAPIAPEKRADGKPLGALYIPIVPLDWRSGEAVPAFVLRGTYPLADAERQVSEAASIRRLMKHIGYNRVYEQTVRGTRLDLATAAPFLAEKFPLVPQGSVLIQEGSKPPPVPGLLFIAVVSVLAVGYSALCLHNQPLASDRLSLSENDRG